jgi:hypothetical protein
MERVGQAKRKEDCKRYRKNCDAFLPAPEQVAPHRVPYSASTTDPCSQRMFDSGCFGRRPIMVNSKLRNLLTVSLNFHNI